MLKRLALKYWPMVLLAILIAAVLGMSRYAEKRKTENSNNSYTSSPKPSIPPSDASQGTQNANKPEHYPSWVDTFTWPDGATVWALFLTLLVIAWQSTETRDAAKASLLNVQALINIERPWLFITVERSQIFETLDEWFDVVPTNRGRTPAEIISFSLPAVAIVTNESDLPSKPAYGTTLFPDSPVIALAGEPAQTFIQVDGADFRKLWKTEENRLRIMNSDEKAYAFGIVCYRDLLGDSKAKPHETRWCFRYMPDVPEGRLIPSGPKNYIRYT
jgi:hypothetical protein